MQSFSGDNHEKLSSCGDRIVVDNVLLRRLVFGEIEHRFKIAGWVARIVDRKWGEILENLGVVERGKPKGLRNALPCTAD